MKEKLNKVYKLIRGFFPERLPQGVTEFNVWANDIISTYRFPDNDSVRFALATMVMHQGPTAAFRSKFYFAIMVWAGASKQVASQVFNDIKTKQMEELKKKQAEATAASVASDVQQPTA